jgi:hypothetical protein
MRNTTPYILQSEHYPTDSIEASATNTELWSKRLSITQMNIYIYATEVFLAGYFTFAIARSPEINLPFKGLN